MKTTLAFDIYGTLIDTNGVTEALEMLVGGQAGDISKAWRDKQLEYSFRRGLMRDYVDFGACTRQALDQVCLSFGIDISDQEKDGLMAVYRTLPVFGDVVGGLEILSANDYRMYAFSNGRADMVRGLLEHNSIGSYFDDVISVDEIKSFKPAPEVYRHFLKRTGSNLSDSWLVSGNPFDVLGAMSTGMNGLWLKRSPEAVFDPWDVEPTVTANLLTELPDSIKNYKG